METLVKVISALRILTPIQFCLPCSSTASLHLRMYDSENIYTQKTKIPIWSLFGEFSRSSSKQEFYLSLKRSRNKMAASELKVGRPRKHPACLKQVLLTALGTKKVPAHRQPVVLPTPLL